MKGVLADVNVQGHFQVLLAVLQTKPWEEFWSYLGLTNPTFADLGLLPTSPDRVVWQTCQQNQLVLVTANRNAEGSDSLETTIRTLNQPDSLPVITLADPDRILRERSYAERTAVGILDILFDIENRRGVGRLYAP